MNSAILKGNWKIAKGKLKKEWSKLSDDDISEIDGSYDELLGMLQKAYGYKKEDAKREITAFIKHHGLDHLADDAERLTDSILRKASEVRDTAERFATSSAKDFVHKTEDLQENVITYVKQNPIKSIGFAMVVGALAAALLKKS